MDETQSKALSSENYDHLWAELPDFIQHNPGARHRRRKILKLLQKVSFSSVLDVGCGPGELLLSLKRAFPQVQHFEGVDLSPEIIARSAAQFPEMKFSTLNVETSALPRKFDLILCSEVIEHLEDRSVAYHHLTQMLNPGGYLVITCPTGKIYATERHFGHVSHPSLTEIKALSQMEGLRIVRLENWGWPTYKLFKEVTNFNSEWAIRNFGSGKYSWVKKLISGLIYWINFLNLSSRKRGCQLFALLQAPKNSSAE